MTYAPVHKDVDPNLPIGERLTDILPLEFFCLCNQLPTLTLVFQPIHDECPLLLGQEFRCLRKVMQQPEARERNEDRDNALQNEDPPPTLEVAHAVHLADTEREEAREGAGDRGSGEEHGLAELDLVATVPHSQVVYAMVHQRLAHLFFFGGSGTAVTPQRHRVETERKLRTHKQHQDTSPPPQHLETTSQPAGRDNSAQCP